MIFAPFPCIARAPLAASSWWRRTRPLLYAGMLCALPSCGGPRMPSESPVRPKGSIVQPRPPQPLPDLASTKSRGAVTFSVGVGRADITPPPGASLAGHGPGGRVAIGHWTRLQCRSFYVDPTEGKQRPLAFVSCELPQMSTLLVRDTIEELRIQLQPDPKKKQAQSIQLDEQTSKRLLELDATRLMIAATHTHAGPGHFFDSKNMGGFASSHFPGFDREMARFLARKVAASLIEAASRARPAEFREVRSHVWGLSRNSAFQQFQMNEKDPSLPLCWTAACQALLPDERAIDPTLRLLEFRAADASQELMGVMAFYALHPTFIGNQNRHYGGDVFGVTSRLMELELEREACLEREGRDCDRLDPAFAFFNTNEADAQPRRVGGTRQEVLANGLKFARAIFRTHCIDEAPLAGPASAATNGASSSSKRSLLCQKVKGVGEGEGASDDPGSGQEPGETLHFDEQQVQAWSDSIAISSAYVELDLPGATLRDPFFDFGTLRDSNPRDRARLEDAHTAELTRVGTMGLSSMRGSQSNPSAMLFLTPTTIEVTNPLGSGRDAEFKKPKRSIPLSGGATKTVPIALVQLGTAFLSFVPAEITLTVGLQINQSVSRAVRNAQADPFIVGLANGYVSYLTTEQEYELQAYHGGSTLYGRESAQYFAYAFGCLAQYLEAGESSASDGALEAPPRCGPHLIGQARDFRYETGPQRRRLWRQEMDGEVQACALEHQGKKRLPADPCRYEEQRCAGRQDGACLLEQAICRMPPGGQYLTRVSRQINGEGPPPVFCFRWRDRGPNGVLGDDNPYQRRQDEDWLVRAVAAPPGSEGSPVSFFPSEPMLRSSIPEAPELIARLRESGLHPIDDRGTAFTTQVLLYRRGAWEWSTVFRPSWEQWRTLRAQGDVRLQVRQFSPEQHEVSYLQSPRLDEDPDVVPYCTAKTMTESCPTGG